MNYQTKAFKISLLLHGALFSLFLILSTQVGPSKKLMVIDFNLSKPEPSAKKVLPAPPAAPSLVPKKKEIKPDNPPTLKEKDSPKPMDEKPEQAPSPGISPVIKLPEAQSQGGDSVGLGMVPASKSIREGTPGGIAGGSKEGTGTGLSGGGGNSGSDGGKESAKSRYLREHFAYIRDRILGNVNYPVQARRMGWQGKVTLSFIIAADGSVREIKILQSSGFAVLDKNALETINDTAPFPKPPVEAELVIPIIYRLE